MKAGGKQGPERRLKLDQSSFRRAQEQSYRARDHKPLSLGVKAGQLIV